MGTLKDDLTGKRFGHLTVVKFLRSSPSRQSIYECKCDCGRTIESFATSLKLPNGKRSCGICNLGKPRCYDNDLTGITVGNLQVIERTNDRSNNGTVLWICACSCGRLVEVTSSNLRAGATRSCGQCGFQQKRSTQFNTVYNNEDEKTLATRLTQMRQRCFNPNATGYGYYGEKGITVCDEWMKDAKSFINWSLEHGWRPGLEIDRIDNSRPYAPDNCRWVERIANANNKTNNVFVSIADGTTHTLAEWSRILDIPVQTLYKMNANDGLKSVSEFINSRMC